MESKDLIKRLCNALEIARRAVHLLASLGYQDSRDPVVGVTAEKIVSEIALLLLACKSAAADYTEVSSLICKIAEQLIPHARNEQVVIRLCSKPALVLDFTFAHICLSRLGFPDSQIDDLIDFSLETVSGQERLPHRIFEQEWLKRLRNASDTHAYSDFGLATLSILGKSFDVFTSSRDDVYAFTHAIMYMSDLGERKVRLPRSKNEILADAEATLACCLDRQDYDLCGELLLAWPYLSASWSATAAFAFHVLARVEDVVGFLPASLTRLDRYNSLSEDKRSRYAMATVYHTAYVMGLLCAASLKYRRIPPSVIPSTRYNGSAAMLLKIIDDDGNKPHWRDDFSSLETKSQDWLVPMLMTIALKRAITSRNLERVKSLLAFGLDAGIVNYTATHCKCGVKHQ